MGTERYLSWCHCTAVTHGMRCPEDMMEERLITIGLLDQADAQRSVVLLYEEE